MKCNHCNGTGQVENFSKVGAALRLVRKRARISLNALANDLGFSPGYVSDLELGRRPFNATLRDDYVESLERLRK